MQPRAMWLEAPTSATGSVHRGGGERYYQVSELPIPSLYACVSLNILHHSGINYGAGRGRYVVRGLDAPLEVIDIPWFSSHQLICLDIRDVKDLSMLFVEIDLSGIENCSNHQAFSCLTSMSLTSMSPLPP